MAPVAASTMEAGRFISWNKSSRSLQSTSGMSGRRSPTKQTSSLSNPFKYVRFSYELFPSKPTASKHLRRGVSTVNQRGISAHRVPKQRRQMQTMTPSIQSIQNPPQRDYCINIFLKTCCPRLFPQESLGSDFSIGFFVSQLWMCEPSSRRWRRTPSSGRLSWPRCLATLLLPALAAVS